MSPVLAPTLSTLKPADIDNLLPLYASMLKECAAKPNPVGAGRGNARAKNGGRGAASSTKHAGPDLMELDSLRYKTLPDRVAGRRGAEESKESGNSRQLNAKVRQEDAPNPTAGGWLHADEVRLLLEWKLTRGKNRPTLRSLLASNPTDTITSVSRRAFANYENTKEIKTAMDTLCELRGIGPATASLLLSVAFPTEIAFFSDELFAWTQRGDQRPNGRPTPMSIKYNLKEYLQLQSHVSALRHRLENQHGKIVDASDIERTVWVIERLHAQGSSSDRGSLLHDDIADDKSRQHKPSEKESGTKHLKGAKRARRELSPVPTSAPSRSKRRK